MMEHLDSNWQAILASEFDKDYMQQLNVFLQDELKNGAVIYPKQEDIFQALNSTSFDAVKVVILGQDPYHGAHQAHGLSFSVQKGVKIPPSLKNIFKELESDIVGFKTPKHGNLIDWAKQGVLLLNATLTVEKSAPGSHQKKGWENLTDHIIKTLSNERKSIVFILWGKFAQQKEQFIDQHKHFIIKSAHPSPFSAHQGFLGSKPFSKTNEILISKGLSPINWQITDEEPLNLFS